MIRKLDKENLDEIIDLIFQTTILYNTSNELKNDVQSKELFADFFKESFDDMELYGYFEEGKIIGVIGIENNDYIPVLYVLDKYQKKGIGIKLLEFTKSHVKNKTDKISVCADHKVIPFYEKNGFQKDKETEDKALMSCNISKIKHLRFSEINCIISFLWNFIKKDFGQNSSLVESHFKNFAVKETLNGLNFYGFYNENLLKGLIGIKENYIMFLYVLEQYQRQGIGTQLLDYALDNLSCESIYVDTNEKSLTFYEKYGFVVDEQKENKHSVVMRLRRKKYGK